MKSVRNALLLGLGFLMLLPACNRERIKALELLNLGVEAESRDLHSKAIKLLTEAVEMDPTCEECHYSLATVYEKTEDLPKAAEHYRRSIELDAEKAETHYRLGEVYKAQGKLEDAEVAFGKAIELSEDHYRAYFKLGQCLVELGRIEEGGAALKKSAELYPTGLPEAFVDYTILFMDLGWLEPRFYADAMKVAMEGIRLNDTEPKLHNLLGTVYADKEPPEYEKAISEFKRSRELDPKMFNALFGMGMTYYKMGDKEKAREVLEEWSSKVGDEARPDQKSAANHVMIEAIEGKGGGAYHFGVDPSLRK